MKRRPPPTPRKADRASPTLAPAVKLYLYAEGKTEQGWAEWLHSTFRVVRIEIDCEGQAGAPSTLLEKAKRKARELTRAGVHSSRDEVWIVFDKDDHHEVPNTLKGAHDAGIGVVFSNESFELWPLLHFAELTRNTPRAELHRDLSSRHPSYDHDRGAEVDWPALAAAASSAVERAKSLHRRAAEADAPTGNPTTTAWLLHERCRTAGCPDLPEEVATWLVRFLPRTLRPTP